jgi:hypothetical protein
MAKDNTIWIILGVILAVIVVAKVGLFQSQSVLYNCNIPCSAGIGLTAVNNEKAGCSGTCTVAQCGSTSAYSLTCVDVGTCSSSNLAACPTVGSLCVDSTGYASGPTCTTCNYVCDNAIKVPSGSGYVYYCDVDGVSSCASGCDSSTNACITPTPKYCYSSSTEICSSCSTGSYSTLQACQVSRCGDGTCQVWESVSSCSSDCSSALKWCYDYNSDQCGQTCTNGDTTEVLCLQNQKICYCVEDRVCVKHTGSSCVSGCTLKTGGDTDATIKARCEAGIPPIECPFLVPATTNTNPLISVNVAGLDFSKCAGETCGYLSASSSIFGSNTELPCCEGLTKVKKGDASILGGLLAKAEWGICTKESGFCSFFGFLRDALPEQAKEYSCMIGIAGALIVLLILVKLAGGR